MKALSAAGVVAAILATGSSVMAANYVEAIVFQSKYGDVTTPFYEGEFGVHLDSSEVTNVTVARSGLPALSLLQESDGWWLDFTSPDFAALQTAVNGTWDLQVSVGATVIGEMTFILAVPAVTAEEAFPKLPTITNPLHGAVIAEGTPITATWTHPSTDPLENQVDYRFANVYRHLGPDLNYNFATTTTSWALGVLPVDQYQLEIEYANAAPEAEFAGMIQLSSATPGFWSASPMAPAYWPTNGTPFLASVSSHEVAFTVPEPASLGLLGVGGLLLGRRRR
jgi:hypothetical protein